MEVRQRLLGVLESVLGPQARQLGDDHGPGSVPGWDSVAHLNVVLAVEEEFGVSFDTADIPRLRTVGAFLARLQQR